MQFSAREASLPRFDSGPRLQFSCNFQPVIRVNFAVKPIRVSSYLGALVIGGLLQASMAAADAPSSDSQGPNAQPSISAMVVGLRQFISEMPNWILVEPNPYF